MKLNLVVIGVGSNIRAEENIGLARAAIESAHELVKASSFVKTEPLGFKDQPEFTNGAFLIKTEMDPGELKSWLKNLENKLGRVTIENNNGPRTIDLDIVVWNKEIVDDEVNEREYLRKSIHELIPDLELGPLRE
jgi:2-amino-4-hydroxy-6-hydroxymethyldihydropteridine diphosphokinase